MKLFSAFKTLPWEQREPERRAAAVREEQAPELLAKLAQIAVQDPEAVVRRAALARLSVPTLLLERHRVDPDAQTRAVALARLSKLLLDPAAGLAPGARLAAAALDLPQELLERVAESAPEIDARRAALARISRPAFLLRRCGEETDPALREALLERIEGEDALDRLAETLRKRDKTLARRARERAESLRLQRGDAAALQRYALGLCDTLTAWAQALPADVESRIEVALQQWVVQRERLDAAMQARVEAYFERVRGALARREQRAVESSAPPAPPPPPPDAGPEALAPLLMQGEAAYPEQVEAAPPPAGPDWSEFDRVLGEAHRAAIAKQLGEARPALQQLRELMKTLPRLDRARRERLGEAELKVEELDQWQRWSGNRVRARLCEEMEALIAAGHHPDAVANRVRELQQEWAKIEAAEPGDADRTSGLARRFRALCGRAMAPTRPYFEQRHALREQRRIALDAQLVEAEPEALAALAVPAAIGLRRRLMEALRTLDDLEPKARTAMARRLREALARIDARLDAQREDAALARRKLIARLRRELTQADPVSALELARQAQQEWKLLPRAAREQEAALEQELAALVDPLFAREREQREQSAQQAGQRASESRRILDELAALAQGDAAALAHADGRIAALQAAWKELHAASEPAPRAPERDPRRGRDAGPARGGRRDERGGGDRREREPRAPRASDSERIFDQAVAQVRQAQAARAAAHRGDRLAAIAHAAQLFADVEQGGTVGDAAEARWLALPLDDADRRRLAARWQRAQSGAGVDAAADAAADAWLVEAEMDASLDSPADAQPLRRERQMQRLATRLQGATAVTPDPLERLLAWAQLGPLDPSRHAERHARLLRVLEAWKG